MENLPFTLLALGGALALFAAMVAFLEIGRWVGKRKLAQHGEAGRKGVGVVDGAVYSLLALLIGFAFSDAASRFHHRRELLINQVEAIHAAYERVDLVPAAYQEPVRGAFRRYLDAVLFTYDQPPGSEREEKAREQVAQARTQLWRLAVTAVTSEGGEQARMLLLPSSTEMFGAVEQERLARRVHAPPMVFVMIILMALVASVFAGFALAPDKRRSWMFIFGVAGAVSLAIFVIIDLEFPRAGLIRVDVMDRALVELRSRMQ